MKYFQHYWSLLGVVIAICILIQLGTKSELSWLDKIAWLNFVFLLLHQFEEYYYPGHFQEFYNSEILNSNRAMRYPLNVDGVLLVNVVFGWTFYLLAAILGDRAIPLTLGFSGVLLLNGILHSYMFFRLGRYNPGLITSLMLLVPFGIYVIYRAGTFASQIDWSYAFLVFLIGTFSVPLSLRLTNR